MVPGRVVHWSKLVVALAAFLLLVPAARSDSGAVVWTAPTPTEQTRVSVTAGTPVSLTLTATAAVAGTVVHIDLVGGPEGAVLNSSDGPAARATFEWTPQVPSVYAVQFTASTLEGDAAPVRTVFIHVTAPIQYPRAYSFRTGVSARWATVWKRSAVRSRPSSDSPLVTTLETITTDGTQNIVLVLDGVDRSATETWYRVRLAILPNNSTGWVRADNLGRLFTVRTHLYIDRRSLTATLERDGAPIFRADIGIGRSESPTPRGEFYVRNKLTKYADPFYGPVAFGTNGRSPVLTDWPDGGIVGIHGTNRPDLLPGRVSHGCIHLRNPELLKLARLMSVGTPVTIR